MEQSKQPQTIAEYIASCPAEVRPVLESLRAAIRVAAPEAEEKISWQMPTFAQWGNLVHFAAHKAHVGFYPAPSGITHFAEALKEYHCSKGAVQFPYAKPLPLPLVEEIVRFRVAENKAAYKEKAARRQPPKPE